MTGQSCANCRYAMPTAGTDELICRRFPPGALTIINGQQMWVFPGMKPSGWCGEWKQTGVVH